MFTPQPERRGQWFFTGATGSHEYHETRRALAYVREAVDDCWERDVRPEIEPALAYIEGVTGDDRPTKRLRRVLGICDPMQRLRESRVVLRLIERTLPCGWEGKGAG